MRQYFFETVDYINNILAVEFDFLVDNKIIGESNLKQMIYNKDRKTKVVKLNRGCKNSPVWLAYHSLPKDAQQKIIKIRGNDPELTVKREPIANEIEIDYDAFTFYTDYRYEDGNKLDYRNPDKITHLGHAASILNLLKKSFTDHKEARAAHGLKPLYSEFYKNKVAFITDESVIKEFPYGKELPINPRRLREKLEKYIRKGYAGLIKDYKGNVEVNARIVTPKIEKLILGLYAHTFKPYCSTVHEAYMMFMSGSKAVQVVDIDSGEIFNPDDFIKNGEPVKFSDATAWAYINKPSNRTYVDRLRNDDKWFDDKHGFYHLRKPPEFTLSKTSMDDRDIPNSDVKAYYNFEVLSGCIIGKAYSKNKDQQLFIDCLRDTFFFLRKHDLPTPGEVEVERHLVSLFKDSFMKAGVMFPYVRWCKPRNPKEKYADKGIGMKKYQVEKQNQKDIGRFYLKQEANRPPQVGEWDENGMTIKEDKRDFDKAVAEDLYTIQEWNNQEHPKFKGMTRMEVLLSRVFPKLPQLDWNVVARNIGEVSRKTSIKKTLVRTMYSFYRIPDMNILQKLKPNNLNVLAYYMQDPENQEIPEIFIYQGDEFICECKKVERYNTARIEWTDADKEAYTQQAKDEAKFHKHIKDGKNSIKRLQVIETDPIEPDELETEVVKVASQDEPDDWNYDIDNEDIGKRAIDEF